MEPQLMIAGQAAGVAAALANRDKKSVHSVDVTELQKILTSEGQILKEPAKL
jgi:hypothetical protein